jgi:multicopper oxidase
MMPEHQRRGSTVLVAVGQTRDVEIDAIYPGDWIFHCHMSHHMMNQMSHAIPNMVGLIILAASLCYVLRHHWGIRGNTFVVVALLGLFGLVTITGWLGAEVVYRHGVGVMTSKPSGSEHHHHHHHDGSEEGHVHE